MDQDSQHIVLIENRLTYLNFNAFSDLSSLDNLL